MLKADISWRILSVPGSSPFRTLTNKLSPLERASEIINVTASSKVIINRRPRCHKFSLCLSITALIFCPSLNTVRYTHL